jgi:hypothetical protein
MLWGRVLKGLVLGGFLRERSARGKVGRKGLCHHAIGIVLAEIELRKK